MGRNSRASAPALGPEAVAEMQVAEGMTFPCELTITNNTPRLLIFHDVRLELFGNTRTLLKGEKNSDTVTFKNKDQFIRFESDVQTIASIHGYSSVVSITPVVKVAATGNVPVIPPAVTSSTVPTAPVSTAASASGAASPAKPATQE